MQAQVQIQVLGAVLVRGNGEEHRPDSTGARCLLASLAMLPDEDIPVSEVTDHLWLPSQQTDSSLKTVRRYVSMVNSKIREAGGNENAVLYDKRARTLRLAVKRSEVDYHRFSDVALRARQQQSPGLFDEALALWRGEPLADVEGMWAGNLRADLKQELYAFQHDRFRAFLAAGQADRVYRELARLIEKAPTEEFLADGVEALTLLGRQTEIPAWRKRLAVLADEVYGVVAEPEAVIVVSAPAGSGSTELLIDDVLVVKRDDRVVLDVRLRNQGTGPVNVTAAAVRILERKSFLTHYHPTADYDLLIEQDYNEIGVAHLIKPADVVDCFTLTLGFVPKLIGVQFVAEVVVRFNGEGMAVSKTIRFDSCFE